MGDEGTFAGDIDAARSAAQGASRRDISVRLLAQLAAAQFGPLAGLAVQMGAPLALDAVARLRQRATVAGLSDEDVQRGAAELLGAASVDALIEEGMERVARETEHVVGQEGEEPGDTSDDASDDESEDNGA